MRSPGAIAIIGLACRFPGANDPEAFWRNLCEGRESIARFTDEELLAAGVDPALLADPRYVKSAPVIDGADRFDAAFFGYSPREAEVMDPQHRLFLEVAWEAFEAAGHHPPECPGAVGVFAGAGGVVTSYLLADPYHPDLAGDTASLAYVGNDKDFIATRVSYKLNLTGPSMSVQTACSTSLVAVHLGCQSLLSEESDIVLAGASTIRVPFARGYLAEQGSVHSRNGQCRSFDADGRGVVFGSGVGAVVLRRLEDALEHGDPIRAVIRGTAIANDGADKASFLAPSTAGQARAMARAFQRAGVSPESVGYVECHAAGTWLGDPIEFEALATVFDEATRRRGFCALGSVKPNIGHPEQAAGMAGLIKTVLATEHATLPPNLNFDRPNPHIDFDASPFYVNTELREWQRNGDPRRACVNSLGIGGTNAFAVIEEAPPRPAPKRDATRDCHVLTLSAKSATALGIYAERLREFVAGRPDPDPNLDLAALCYTTNASRSQFPYRLAISASSVDEMSRGLAAYARRRPARAADEPKVAFLFTGQGSQHPGMGAALYAAHPCFRDALDRCARAFAPLLPRPLLEVMFGADEAQAPVHQMAYAQPALFALEYGLATLWREWGVTPHAVLGHSLGELVAACVAGAVDFDHAVPLVAARGRLMQALPERGSMAAVFASEAAVSPHLPGDETVVVAAANGPHNTVVSGEHAALAATIERLTAAGLDVRPLSLSNAYHSPLVEPMLRGLEAAARAAEWRSPGITMISNVTGEVMAGAIEPSYWCEHALRAVRFEQGVRALGELGCNTFVEIGSGATLVSLGAQVLPASHHRWVPSLARELADWPSLMAAAGALYEAGAPVDWRQVHRGANHCRVPLPTYPFEGKRFWVGKRAATRVETGAAVLPASEDRSSPMRLDRADGVAPIAAARREAPALDVDRDTPLPAVASAVDEWLYEPCWRACPRVARADAEPPGSWILFDDAGGFGQALATALAQRGASVHRVVRADALANVAPGRWALDPGEGAHFTELLERVCAEDDRPLRGVVYLWGLDAEPLADVAASSIGHAVREAARGALSLARAVDEASARARFTARLHVVTRNACDVDSHGPPTEALQALLWGLGRTFALECPDHWGGLVDLGAREADRAGECAAVIEDLCAPDGEDQIAYRDGSRFALRLARAAPEIVNSPALAFREDASYLITGGLGMIGLETARYLVERAGVRSLLLAGRRGASAAGAAAVDALRARGARVQVVEADVGDADDVERLLAAARDMPPLRGVVHCAGILDNALLGRMDWAQFERVATAKVAGAFLLDRCTRDLPIDVFVLHSSLLGLIGSPGQGNYTAANAFLDALAARRRAQGFPATVIDWTAWAGGGLAGTAGAGNEAAWLEHGLSYIAAADAMSAFERIVASRAGQTVVAVADWRAYVRQFRRPPALFRELAESGAPAVPDGEAGPVVPRSRAELVALLREHVSEEMGFDELVDAHQPLRDVGLHSLLAASLAIRLSHALGIPVALVTLVRGPSIEEIAEALWTELPREHASPNVSVPVTASVSVARIKPSRTTGGGWLVCPRPNPNARVRLFCFPYAGGNAATYRPWAELLDPDVELVAIEPPGRADRIDEPVIASLDAFFDSLLPAMAPYLDRPAAFFGHCLGALTLFEAARRLRRDGVGTLSHLFVSGARPPQSLLRVDRFEEALLERLLALEDYDPFVNMHEQPDDVFSELIRHFDIGLSEDFLANAELRRLLMPAIRGEFTMAARYRYRPEPAFDVPITCFSGLDDPYATREDAVHWSEHTTNAYRLHLRKGDHFLVADDREYIVETINHELRL